MSPVLLLLQQVVLLMVLVSSCHGYNVDLLSPLIVNSGLDPDQQASYRFGFSLTHHVFSNGEKRYTNLLTMIISGIYYITLV